MNELKNFIFNSLTVSTGLIIYTLFIYLAYLMFFSSSSSEEIKDNNKNNKNNNKDNNNKDKIEDFDVLEDV